jgi:hypothetical protein
MKFKANIYITIIDNSYYMDDIVYELEDKQRNFFYNNVKIFITKYKLNDHEFDVNNLDDSELLELFKNGYLDVLKSKYLNLMYRNICEDFLKFLLSINNISNNDYFKIKFINKNNNIIQYEIENLSITKKNLDLSNKYEGYIQVFNSKYDYSLLSDNNEYINDLFIYHYSKIIDIFKDYSYNLLNIKIRKITFNI